MVQIGHQPKVLLAGEQLVDGGELAGHADRCPTVRVADHVMTRDPDLPGVRGIRVDRIRTIVVLPAPLVFGAAGGHAGVVKMREDVGVAL